MIPAFKSGWFTRWFARDARKRIERSFSSVRVRGMESLSAALERGPVLVVTNHTSWWDPLVALVVSTRVAGADAYAMMDAANLVRLPFFGKVGAFGVEMSDAADGARAMRYAAKLLTARAHARRLVWIFAQGREVPVTVRPLGFRSGSGEIARIAKSRVVCGAIRYEMGRAPEPVLWLSFGEAIDPGPDVEAARVAHEAAVEAELARIERAIGGDDAAFATLHTKRESIAFRLATRALAWLVRPRLHERTSTSAPPRSTRSAAPRQ